MELDRRPSSVPRTIGRRPVCLLFAQANLAGPDEVACVDAPLVVIRPLFLNYPCQRVDTWRNARAGAAGVGHQAPDPVESRVIL